MLTLYESIFQFIPFKMKPVKLHSNFVALILLWNYRPKVIQGIVSLICFKMVALYIKQKRFKIMFLITIIDFTPRTVIWPYHVGYYFQLLS